MHFVKKAMNTMRNTIGFPTGLWADYELLRFGNPTQGSELRTAVEMMFSLEKIVEITYPAMYNGQISWSALHIMCSQHNLTTMSAFRVGLKIRKYW